MADPTDDATAPSDQGNSSSQPAVTKPAGATPHLQFANWDKNPAQIQPASAQTVAAASPPAPAVKAPAAISPAASATTASVPATAPAASASAPDSHRQATTGNAAAGHHRHGGSHHRSHHALRSAHTQGAHTSIVGGSPMTEYPISHDLIAYDFPEFGKHRFGIYHLDRGPDGKVVSVSSLKGAPQGYSWETGMQLLKIAKADPAKFQQDVADGKYPDSWKPPEAKVSVAAPQHQDTHHAAPAAAPKIEHKTAGQQRTPASRFPAPGTTASA